MKGCLVVGGIIAVILLLFAGCGVSTYNGLVTREEGVESAWSEIQNQYQRRFDLVPQLVATVQGAADFEKSTITEVTEARASVGRVAQPTAPEDPQQLAEYMRAQEQLSGALSRLLVVAENYPQLRATEGFRDLQAQLEGTENRIAVARNRFIKAVEAYNVTVRSFPTNLTAMLFGHKPKPNFTVEDEKAIAAPPKVDFGSKK
jgi:LemA protein